MIDAKEWADRAEAETERVRQTHPGSVVRATKEATIALTVDLIRAVIADEAAKSAPQPVAAGDVPGWRWCIEIAREIVDDFETLSTMKIADMIGEASESEISRRVAEATADKDKRIAELERDWNLAIKTDNSLRQQLAAAQAEVARLTKERDAAQGRFEATRLDAVKETRLVNDLRQEVARLTRPVEGVDWADVWNRYYMTPGRYEDAIRTTVEPLLQAERNAREAAEAERDELREACKALFDAPHQEHFAARMNDEETVAMERIRKLMVAYRAERAVKQ